MKQKILKKHHIEDFFILVSHTHTQKIVLCSHVATKGRCGTVFPFKNNTVENI